jgi:hypothetical protein
MTHIRNERTIHQRRRAGATLALAAATGGLLAAAMAGSPAARADDPFTDIATYVQDSITAGEADYSAAGMDFSTAGDTNEGLAELFTGNYNTFLSPVDYTVLGLVAAGTDTDYSTYADDFVLPDGYLPTTAAEATTDASTYSTNASDTLSEASSYLSAGNYFDATEYFLYSIDWNFLAGQSETLGALFSAGI